MALKKGKMKGKQRGHAVAVKGYSYKRGKKNVNVRSYTRGKPGGKKG